ncbi:Vegetative incompatibility protein HET-E-1 [Ceratocystis lukuohia]|uniref:Mitochondrial division protein 1 n=1 Tax=Ceratocystis lukuohia TaxID=2019550 RepID=A0ABR4MF80_9PEZI
MNVDESIRAYTKLSQTGFYKKPSIFNRSQYSFSAKKLETAIKLAIRENCCEVSCVENRRQKTNSTPNTCTHTDMCFYEENCVKTAVLAVTKNNINAMPTIFTTYPPLSTRLAECTVWQIARATSAAVAFFKPIKLGRDGIEFIDAAFNNNNPCETLIREAEKLFPRHETIALSLGTGLDNVVEIDNLRSSITSALKKMVSSSKCAHQRLKYTYRGTNNYHRLDVISGLMDVTLLDSSALSKIAGLTENYLNENVELVTACVNVLAENENDQEESDKAEGNHNVDIDKDNKQCLSDLSVTDPRIHKKEIEDEKGGLLKDSYKWILSHNNFLQFRNGSECQILWIKGDPGKGKTMLLCGIIDELTTENSATLSYFFCQTTSSRLNTATSVMRGLIYHLARCNPQLINHVRNKYDYKRELFKHEIPWHDLCEILTAMVNDTSLKNVILIVDGLDECSLDRPKLLQFITEPSPAKWIVSSRNWLDIEEVLDDAEQKVKIHLEMNQDSVSAAVDSFIEFKVDQLTRKKKCDDAKKTAMLEYLKTNSNGTFLWVALVCHELSNPHVRNWHIVDTMKSLPPGLDPLYRRMMINMSESKDAQLCKDIVAYVFIVYRPITLDELHVLVEGLEDKKAMEVEEIIALCGSFLTIHNNVVSFVHQSVKDFFQNKALQEILPLGIPHQHHKVLLRSLGILQKRLQRDIYGLQAPGCLIGQVSVPEHNPLAALGYVCIFWVDHLCNSAVDDVVSLNDGILPFFERKYLQWLEALSLLHSISSAGRIMERLTAFLQEKASKDLQGIAKDAQRFLLSHGGVIEIAPLQVYASGLIFSPTNSLIRRIYSHEEPDWIELKPQVGENWDVCLQTLEGHCGYVHSVTFSNDGDRLASGSRDKTIKIWDVTSGVCLQTLEGHSHYVHSVVFSNDGQRLASGSSDSTVKIWNATSGVCLQTLKGHDDSVYSVAFSNDGQRLASASLDKTVKIWDATSGACLQTFEGHSGFVRSVVFSNDGQRLASASLDMTVKIWDATSGACLQTLQGHSNFVYSVVISNYGQRLASASLDMTVKIWDVTSGVCLQTFEGHSDYVDSVVFSNYGQRLASGSWDKTVKIWDVTSGACLQTLESHGDFVPSLVFSNYGQRLASASLDMTVKIWDATSGACLQTFEGHSDYVDSVVFSNYGQRLASGSWDKTVKIWDVTSGACLQTLESHSDDVRSMVFSNDGQRLASGSYDKTVKIWDATSGACLQTLEGHDDVVYSVVFSNDAQQLASGSSDKTIKIWDVTSGVCMQTLEGHGDFVPSLVFSNYGQRLASASLDMTVKIWDVTSGVCMQTLEGHGDFVPSLVFSNYGQRLASASLDMTVKIWDVTSGVCLHTLEGHSNFVHSVVFSHDGQRLASGSLDETVKIWDVISGACLHTLEGHNGVVYSVTFSNDGDRLASGSDDQSVKIWDATSGVCLQTLEGHSDYVHSVVFSNDGQRLASGSSDSTVKIWNATSGVCLQTLKIRDGIADPRVVLNTRRSSSALLVDQAFRLPSRPRSYSISEDDVWIMQNQQSVLWLPPSFRPRIFTFSSNKVGLASDSGRITLIGFKSTALH